MGVVRNKSFIPNDIDIDIGVYCDNPDAVTKLLKKKKFIIHAISTNEKNKNILLQISKYKVLIDIEFFDCDKSGVFYLDVPGAQFPKNIVRTDNEQTGMWKYNFDTYFFGEVQRYTFQDIEINIPKNYQRYLEAYYGSNWQTPIDYSMSSDGPRYPVGSYVENEYAYSYRRSYPIHAPIICLVLENMYKQLKK